MPIRSIVRRQPSARNKEFGVLIRGLGLWDHGTEEETLRGLAQHSRNPAEREKEENRECTQMDTNDGEGPTDLRTPQIDLSSNIELGFNPVGSR